MKPYHFFVFLLGFLSLISCDDDDKVQANLECLEFSVLKNSNKFCVDYFDEDCFSVSLGHKPLAELAKQSFVQFCDSVGSKMEFANVFGEILDVQVDLKDYTNSIAAASRNRNSPSCTDFCLATEDAYVDVSSHKFSLRIGLRTAFDKNQLTSSVRQSIRTEYYIESIDDNWSELLLTIPFLDSNDDEIDNGANFYSGYEPEMILNGTRFEEVYFSGSGAVIGFGRPKAYFTVEEGLIAVQGYSSELWVKKLVD